MSSLRQPKQLEMFSRAGEVVTTASCSPSRIVGTGFGRRGKSALSAQALLNDARGRALALGTSGLSNSPSGAGRTITSSSGSRKGSASTSKTSAATGRTG